MDFFSPKNLSIEKAVRRAYTFSEKMHKDLKAHFFEGKPAATLARIAEMDREVDSLSFLVLRQATGALSDSMQLQTLKMTPQDCVHFILLMRNIEKIADYARISAEKTALWKGRMQKNELDELHLFHSSALSCYSDAVCSFIELDIACANRTLLEILQLLEGAKPAIQTQPPFFYDNLLRTLERSSAIAQLAITRGICSRKE